MSVYIEFGKPKKKPGNNSKEVTASQISDQAVMEQIEKLKQMIYSAEMQKLLAPTKDTEGKEEAKEG